jgi:glucose-1-phosphate thymidylyltransferase
MGQVAPNGRRSRLRSPRGNTPRSVEEIAYLHSWISTDETRAAGERFKKIAYGRAILAAL